MAYPSDLKDRERALISGHFKNGNQAKHEKRTLVNAVLYVVRTGCQWRWLPQDFPKDRKRPIVTDKLGNLLHIKVHAANQHDTIAGVQVFEQACKKYPSLQAVSLDLGYQSCYKCYEKDR